MPFSRDLMSADPNKKTPRNFQCRDILWDAFQQMAQELECSVDYLINESMKQYARQRYAGRNQRTTDGVPPATGSSPEPPSAPRPPVSSPGASLRAPGGAPLPPPPPRGRGPSNLPPPPMAARGGSPTVPSRVPGSPGSGPPGARTVPPPLPGRPAPLPPPQGMGRLAPPTPSNYAGQLTVLYAG